MAMVVIKRSDGRTFAFGDIFRIVSYGLVGVGLLEVQIFTENKAVGDGDIVTGRRLPPRTIKIESLCISRAVNTHARRLANDFFSPLYAYELHIDYKGSRAWIGCHLEVFNLPTENIHAPQALHLSFFCPNPYFLSEDNFGKNIAQVTAATGFPYIDHPRVGVVAAVYDFSQSVVLINDGHAVTYPVVSIIARRTVENPSIIKDGLFVKVLDRLGEGDKIIIDFDEKTVTKNGENIVHKLSKDSSLTRIAFEVGSNLLSYDADSGANVMNVYVSYHKRYVGV